MRRTQAFWWGYGLGVAMMAGYQDVLGRDAYVREVERNWVSAWLTLPLEVLLAVVAVAMLVRATRIDREDGL